MPRVQSYRGPDSDIGKVWEELFPEAEQKKTCQTHVKHFETSTTEGLACSKFKYKLQIQYFKPSL